MHPRRFHGLAPPAPETTTMPPKIAVSDDESEELNIDALGSDSEEISDAVLDDEDDEDVEEEDVEEMAEDSEDYEPEETSRPQRGTRTRETRKRQLAFYEDDDIIESEEEVTPQPRKVTVKLRKPAAKADEGLSDLESDYKQDTLRMTERQRAKLMEDDTPERYEELMFAKMDEQLLSLNRKTAKKKETAEQIALRKAENARRRADYKTKQLEEEKRDTLNKLLKRRATKTREKQGDDVPESKRTLKPRRPTAEHPALVRWVCKPEVSLVGLPE